MKTYRIAVWEEQSGYVNVPATSERAARAKADEELEENGIESEQMKKWKVEITHRDTALL